MEIRADQLKALQEDAWRRFEEEMVEHAMSFAPKHCKVVGEAQVRLAVRLLIVRAAQYGFTKRGPIRLFLELGLLCGSSFDTDPQFAVLSAALRGNEEQMLRAQQMHEEHNAFEKQVPELSTPEALAKLKQMAREAEGREAIPNPGFAERFVRELVANFPERTRYIGEQGLLALMQEGGQLAAHYKLSSSREVRVVLLLMFCFGHGCAADPMFPWIAKTLQDETIQTTAARADHLEKRMFPWLESIVRERTTELDA